MIIRLSGFPAPFAAPSPQLKPTTHSECNPPSTTGDLVPPVAEAASRHLKKSVAGAFP